MPDPEILKTIETVVAEVLGQDDIRLCPEDTADSVPGWDSLSHIQIVVALERHYGIRFNAAQLIDYQNIGALADGIRNKLADTHS